ncbi:MAG: acyltransferase [Muribaculaceae bacterium]|nr:acyltransferase [Muribaculaceae bacterium]
MIKSLQSLRGIFAIAIVFYHYYSRAPFWVDNTSCAVTFFFIMSGFALGLHYRVKDLRNFSFRNFMTKRLSKVYPLHLLLTLVMIYFSGIGWKLWANVFLVQSWFTSESVWFSYNGTSWFVASLVFCYLFFAPISYLSTRWKQGTCYAIIAIATLILMAYYWITPPDAVQWLYYISPTTRLIDFSLGILLARAYSDYSLSNSDISRKKAGVMSIVAALLVISLIALPHSSQIAKAYYLSVVWYIPLALLILTLCIAENKGTVLTRLLSWKPLVWLGNISFEIYMLQVVVSNIVLKLGIITTGQKFPDNLHIFIIIAIVIPLAWLTKRFFTTPVARFLNRNLNIQ